VLNWCDPHRERVWEDASDADETKLLSGSFCSRINVRRLIRFLGLPPKDVLWSRLGSFVVNFGTISLAAVAGSAYRYLGVDGGAGKMFGVGCSVES